MWSKIKSFLKCFLPLPARAHNAQMETVLSELRVLRSQTVRTAELQNQLIRISEEILWAEIFSSTIEGSDWLKNKTFSLSGWAGGHPFLYILYRTLRDSRPRSILELGLGETTKLISQYAASNCEVEHYVVEHNPEWVSFFNQGFNMPNSSKIVHLPLGFIPYKECEKVRVYEGFFDTFSKRKYDLICIDAPWGGDMKQYSRIDSLSLLPDNLNDSFVILIDDYNRSGEFNTAKEIIAILDQNHVKYKHKEYVGQKSTFIICSADLGFLCSL